LEAALAQKAKLIGPGDLPATLSPAQRHTALGFQAKGLEFTKAQARMGKKMGGDLIIIFNDGYGSIPIDTFIVG
jgi:hypothetical protein